MPALSSISTIGDKLVVGQVDTSFLTGTGRVTPGTAVLNGPVYCGATLQVGVARATVMIGPPLPGLSVPASLEVTGITNIIGTLNVFAISTFTGLTTKLGTTIKNALSLKNGVDLKNAFNVGNGASVDNANAYVAGLLTVGGNVTAAGSVTATGTVMGSVVMDTGGNILALKKDKPFDMPHPNKKGWRLRHVCIEGPEIAVYCRGKIPPNGVIELPSFWDGLVNKEDMTINLTPFGIWQELFVQEIRWGKQVIVRNNAGGPINGDYHIVARRLDDDLIVEYEGESHEDYPGGNEGYSFNFEHNYVEGLIRNMVDENLNNIKVN